MSTIHTARLTLRPVTLSDAGFIQQHFSQPDVLEFLPPEVPNPYPADGAQFYLSQIMLPAMQQGKAMEFIISLKDEGTPIGAVMVERKDEDTGAWRRGFWLASAHRGKGYMEEASLAATHWLFSKTEATMIITGNAVGNAASARIKEKQGFLPMGTRVQMPPFHNGETVAQDWKLTRERFAEVHAGLDAKIVE